jgi:hypothetical protein
VNACPFGRCEGDGKIPLHYSEGGDGATYVSWGSCPCADLPMLRVPAVSKEQDDLAKAYVAAERAWEDAPNSETSGALNAASIAAGYECAGCGFLTTACECPVKSAGVP